MKIKTKVGKLDEIRTEKAMGTQKPFVWTGVFLIIILSMLFWKSVDSAYVMFSNDGPLGTLVADQNAVYPTLTGLWANLNWLGGEGLSPAPDISTAMRMLTTPFMYARILPPASLFIVGICACFCFRKFKLAPVACILGGLAAALNSDFLSTSCWGVATQVVGFGANYVALGLLTGKDSRRQWVRVLLAGMAVGIGIMESYDIGAIFSLFVAAFILYKAVFLSEGEVPKKLGLGIGRIALVAGLAAFISAHALTTLIGTQVKGVAGRQQDAETKQQMWPYATQWSLPKAETLQVLIPGLFGYRNQWHMYESDQPTADQYWGAIGAGPGIPRLIGTGFYGGVLVLLIALYGISQSFRGLASPFTVMQRRAIWFWLGVMVFSLLLSFGKFAPFYQFFYALPYASTIRNPDKFMHVFSWALVIVFAYGVHALFLACMQNSVARAQGFLSHLHDAARSFEKKFILGCIGAIVFSVLACVIYSKSSQGLVEYLETVSIKADLAPAIAHFSVMSVVAFIFLLAISVVLLALIFNSQFSGSRAKWGGFFLGLLLVVDLGRADRRWIVYWDVAYKYATDPIVQFLADKPYEHRISILPISPNSQQLVMMQNAYGSHWKQELFPYYNIQCAEVIQEPRVAVDKDAFTTALAPTSIFNVFRNWELTNTKYILGPSAEMLKQLDPEGKQFRVLKTFNFVPKRPDATIWPVDYAAQEDPNGELSVSEFLPALPRAKLFSNWQVNKQDTNVLQMLASPQFDTHQSVLISTDGVPNPLPANAGKDAGTVEINPNYKPKRVEISTDVKVPSVLLLDERYDPKWRVEVDGKPAPLLRCDFILRGVYLEPGKHIVVFRFVTPLTSLYVSLSAIILGMVLSGWLVFTKADEESEPDVEVPTERTEKEILAAPQGKG